MSTRPKTSNAEQYVFWIGRLCIAAVACTAFSGCGNPGDRPVSVSGQVQLDGKPLTSGTVRVVPNNGRIAYGHIDEDGRFKLSCFKSGDGCLLGTHRAEVLPILVEGGKPSVFIPSKYHHIETSGLTVEITGSTDSLTIDLHSTDTKP